MTQRGNRDKKRYFDDAFCSYYERVVLYIYRYCREWDIAENIAQDTFLALWKNLSKVDRGKTPLPYLFFVARNKSLNYLNREAVKRRHRDYLEREELKLSQEALRSSTMDDVVLSEIDEIVKETLERLPVKTKEAFQMSRYGMKLNREIAVIMGVSEKMIEYRIMSALRALRQTLKDYLP